MLTLSVTSHFLSLVSTVSAKYWNAWDHDFVLACTHEKKKKKERQKKEKEKKRKREACIFRVSLLKQTRLVKIHLDVLVFLLA